jgi:hypothetical protein
MVDLDVAITWIAISAASAKGLAALARAAARGETDAEVAALSGEGTLTYDDLHAIVRSPCLPRGRP